MTVYIVGVSLSDLLQPLARPEARLLDPLKAGIAHRSLEARCCGRKARLPRGVLSVMMGCHYRAPEIRRLRTSRVSVPIYSSIAVDFSSVLCVWQSLCNSSVRKPQPVVVPV